MPSSRVGTEAPVCIRLGPLGRAGKARGGGGEEQLLPSHSSCDPLMKFWGDGGGGSELRAKKEFLKTQLVQKSDFLKAGGQDPRREELIVYPPVGRGSDTV